MFVRSGNREGRRMNPHVVPPSQHTLFMRGFHPNTEMNKIRDFFTKEGGKCSFDFFKVSQDGTRLFVALRFESKDVAKEILSRYDNATVIGSKITITWFKDLRRARLKGNTEYKAMQHGQRWNNCYGHMKNGYNRGGYMHNKFGNRMKSTVWRQQGKFHDEHRRSSSSSRSYSRSRSRSRSKSRSRSRSRSWTRSRSHERSVSPRHYRSRSSSSSRASGSDRLKKRSWKHDASQKNEQYGPEIAEKNEEAATKGEPAAVDEVEVKKDESWPAKKNEAPEVQGPRSPASSQERPASRSDSHSRSTSASSHSHGKERKKKKKKHHRSKHRRHRRRHRHQRDSSDEEGQLSDYEEGERSPTPDHHRRYRKRRRQSSSSSQESQPNKNKRGENDKSSTTASNNQSFNMSLNESNQMQQDSMATTDAPLESDGHSIKSLRSLDAPSQVSDGMSPLHVSEGDEEGTPNFNFRESAVDRYAVIQSGSNQQTSDVNDTQLSKFSMQEELDNEDRLLTATRDALLREVHELTASATSGTAPKNITRTKTPSGVKSIIDKFKATMKPASTQVAEMETSIANPSQKVNSPHVTRKEAETRATDLISHSGAQLKSPSAHYAIRTTQNESSRVEQNDYYDPEEPHMMDDSADISREGASGDGPCMDKDFKSSVLGTRRAIRTGGLCPESSAVTLPKDKIALIKRKRAEIEAAYRQDCETFATVVKMLIRKDSKLEEYIQDSLRQNLYEIGQLCVEELKQFVEVVVSTDKL